MNLFSVTQTSLASSPGNLYASQTEEDRIFDSTQLPWKQHLSATKERCNMVFDKLIIIFPEQLTLEKQNILKQKLGTQDDVLFKMIITMHFIVSKYVRCFEQKRSRNSTIQLMKTIDSVLFSGVNKKDFSSLYNNKFSNFDTSSINDAIERFSSEVIEKDKVKDISKDISPDYLLIGDTPKERNRVLYLAYGIKDTVL